MDNNTTYELYTTRDSNEILNQAFRYTMFGLYSVLLIIIFYCLLDKNKRNFPYINLTFITLTSVISSLCNMLTFVLNDPDFDPSNGLCYRMGVLFYMLSESSTWLFLLEPVRQYNKSHNKNINYIENEEEKEKKSNNKLVWWWRSWSYNYYQTYFTSFSGILLFISYLYFLGIMTLSCFYVLTFEDTNTTFGWINTNIIVVKLLYHGTWYFVVMYIYVLVWSKNANHQMNHLFSYFISGLFMIGVQIGKTIVTMNSVATASFVQLTFIWNSSITWVIIYFCLVFVCHFITLLIGLIWGSRWVSFIKYNQLIAMDENHKDGHV
ncbi:unnamed protein product [Cunninghamella echinulata]